MKRIRQKIIAAALVAVTSLGTLQTHAGLFKLDFGADENIAERVTSTNWDTIASWLFTDFPDGIASWKLTDFSADHSTNVTLTITDNAALSAQLGEPPAIGMAGVYAGGAGLDVVYDGINVPSAVKDDYLYRVMDTPGGTEMLFRFANLAPGQYHVTLFEGRLTDVDGQYGKIWVDDINGKKEPAEQNTGDFSGNPLTNPNDPNSARAPVPWGHPQTLVVNIQAGDYLWYAHMESAHGGISGMIIRSWVDSDGDGLPDDWEIQYGLIPHDPSDAATDLNGNGLSNLMDYTCGLDPTDTTKPTLLTAVADAAHNKVVATFSKPIFSVSGIANDPRDATIATNLANYSITPALAITGVAVKGNVVTLTTAKQVPGATPYTLTVNNVRDVNNWPVSANSQATFVIAPPPPSPAAQPYQWFTIAGLAGVTGSDDGTNSAARFNYPNDVAVDGAGNLYVADIVNQTIRKITRDGTNWVTTTIAGLAGSTGSDDGTNSVALFNYPIAIVVDRAGNLYVEDVGNQTIRKITPMGTNWVTTTIAGLSGVWGYADGTNSDARFWNPNGLAVDSAGNLYVGDSGNESVIRKITPVGTDWVTTTIAGLTHFTGSADGTNSAARFSFWYFGQAAVAVGNGGSLYVADVDNQTIRKIAPVGTNWVTTTIAGLVGNVGSDDGTNTAARFNNPSGVAADSAGNVYVSDTVNNTIRQLTPAGTNWVVTTIGGVAGQAGSDDGINSVARFNGPTLFTVDSHGTLFVPDQSNSTIRMGVRLPVFQSVTPVNGHLELIVNTAPGQTVQLQYKSDLASANWTNLGNPITATDGTISATDTPGPGQRRFYRAIVVLP